MTARPDGAGRARRFLIRVGAMAAKEALHIRRDPRTLALGLVMPVVLLLLFGYGVSFDLDRIPLAVADMDQSPASRELERAFLAPGEFALARRVDGDRAEEIFRRRQALAVLAIPWGYQRDLSRGQVGRAQLMVDGSDAVTANQVLTKAEAIALSVGRKRAAAQGLAGAPLLQVKVWTRYNPEARSAVFIVPGMAAYLMAIAAVMLTALAVAGEWERGSMEQLFASPVGRLEIILGKLLPYLALGMMQLLLVLAVGTSAFDVPVRGSPWVILLMGLLFLAGMLGQGLLISVLAKNQLVATQAGALSSLLPSMLLSGMLVPIENMPLPLQWLSRIIPARYLVHALRGAMLKGTGLAALWTDALAMAIFAAAVLTIATVRFKRRVA
ncbi:MAG TPA: ABC transporter permease [Anaeromyxobacteraceae bacterium]|nr:ABC transporter permease [Anaeromyxobacteraceae bacterium]